MDVNDLISNTLGETAGYLVIRAASRTSAPVRPPPPELIGFTGLRTSRSASRTA